MRRFLIVTLTGAVLATLAGPRGPLGGLWRPAPEAPHAHGALLGGFIAENMVENLAFGAGLAILVVGRTWFTARTTTTARATTAWLATVWLLASWMPHAALHQHIGMHPSAMLPVEWIFHIGAIIAAGALVLTLGTPSAADRAGPGHHPADTDTRMRDPR
jgi:hypothetical protein